MQRLVTYVVIWAACGGAQPPAPVTPAPNDLDPVIGELDGIRSRMCACADDTCAVTVGDQHKIWIREHKKLLVAEEDTATDAQIGRSIRLQAAYLNCKKKFAPKPGNAIRKMIEFKDKMCRCVDKACADTVVDEMTKWSQEMAKNADRSARVTEEDTRKMSEVTEEFTKCATKAMTAGMTP